MPWSPQGHPASNGADQARVAGDVGGEDRSETAFYAALRRL
jgi:hypothetical protein